MFVDQNFAKTIQKPFCHAYPLLLVVKRLFNLFFEGCKLGFGIFIL